MKARDQKLLRFHDGELSAEEVQAFGRRPNLDRLNSGWSHFGFEAPSAEDVVAKFPPEIGYTLRTDRPRPPLRAI